MNSTTQTALQMGMEYSEKLQQAALSYQELTGIYPTADGDFWETREIQKIETLSAFWWDIERLNNPYGDGTCYMEDDNYEQN